MFQNVAVGHGLSSQANVARQAILETPGLEQHYKI